MRGIVRESDLKALAQSCGLAVQHDCGGYRVVRPSSGGFVYMFPDSGTCPTETKRACMAYLLGFAGARGLRRVGRP